MHNRSWKRIGACNDAGRRMVAEETSMGGGNSLTLVVTSIIHYGSQQWAREVSAAKVS